MRYNTGTHPQLCQLASVRWGARSRSDFPTATSGASRGTRGRGSGRGRGPLRLCGTTPWRKPSGVEAHGPMADELFLEAKLCHSCFDSTMAFNRDNPGAAS